MMLPTRFFALLTLLAHETAAFSASGPTSVVTWTKHLNPLAWRSLYARQDLERNLAKRQGQGDGTAFDRNPNGSAFLWVLQDTYEGDTFFDRWNFFTGRDPTNGMVNYVDRNTSVQSRLIYTREDGKVIMKGDDYTWLERGVHRPSVRISSWAQYNTGLFILDLDKVPWSCATWPAYWLLGNGPWPNYGEVDIIEGVHDNEHNQVAYHTAPNCLLDPNVNVTSTIHTLNGQPNLICDGGVNFNSGCGFTDWSRATYGPYFDSQGGGVFATKWDEHEISTWSFYRAAVPQDILAGTPNPSHWGLPSAKLLPTNCNPLSKFFINMSIIFDITFCGDWAGNSYATSGCPGTCAERLQDPKNFENATWIINDLKVYRKQPMYGSVGENSAQAILPTWISFTPVVVLWVALVTLQ